MSFDSCHFLTFIKILFILPYNFSFLNFHFNFNNYYSWIKNNLFILKIILIYFINLFRFLIFFIIKVVMFFHIPFIFDYIIKINIPFILDFHNLNQNKKKKIYFLDTYFLWLPHMVINDQLKINYIISIHYIHLQIHFFIINKLEYFLKYSFILIKVCLNSTKFLTIIIFFDFFIMIMIVN